MPKIDREERPDIDQIYMEAVQAMGVNGGWPLHVFLTPDQKPFYGGTYFSPQNWLLLLKQIAINFEEKRNEINASANDLTRHLQKIDLYRFAKPNARKIFHRSALDQQFQILSGKYDKAWGGIEKAPKFVMPTVWLWLLRYHFISKNASALNMVTETLLNMTRGGLYDQLGGGFSRYSVDSKWVVPHFEKMLYDNAQLLSLYAEAYSLTKNATFKSIVYETVGWLVREMMHPDGGFYSALDADSEGIEGKFYAWTYDELVEAVGDTHVELANYFNITKEGNWEHGLNILCGERDAESELIAQGKRKMVAYRESKPRPVLDDKIITAWNAMTIQGLVDCFKAFSDRWFLELALKNILFLEKNIVHNEKIYRSFKNKHSSTEGFLEDYAFLIQAYTSLYQVTFDGKFIHQAAHWSTLVIKNFFDEKDSLFNFSSSSAEQLIAQKKDLFDNVIPSSNSVMARNLFRLGTLLSKDTWKQMATTMIAQFSDTIQAEPIYLSNWAMLLAEITHGLDEVVIMGKNLEVVRNEWQQNYFPFAVTLGATTKSDLALFEGKEIGRAETIIYVCRDKVCQLPVTHIDDAIQLLSK